MPVLEEATLFQPTLPARGATDEPLRNGGTLRISTHAPRTGSDARKMQHGNLAYRHFNPRSPHGERPEERLKHLRRLLFQPTLPARGATPSATILDDVDNFNPRSPHGERRYCDFGHDDTSSFQPTLPARGATGHHRRAPCVRGISTHAPRTGSDAGVSAQALSQTISTHAPRTGSDCQRNGKAGRLIDFNPRSPHGERPLFDSARVSFDKFQPTLPARGATQSATPLRTSAAFQPTLPARGATFATQRKAGLSLFQPTLPARGATLRIRLVFRSRRISTHAPRTGSDPDLQIAISSVSDFNPRSPHGDRHGGGVLLVSLEIFQPTLPARGATQPFVRTSAS